MYIDVSLGIYVKHTFLHNVNLIFAYCCSCGDYLPVNICKTDFIIIYQVKGSYPASHERLAYISSYSSYTEYGNS